MAIFKQVKRLGQDTALYGMGSAVQGFIVFLLFPIYTRVLTQEDFGSQDLVLTAVSIVTFFLILGLDSGAARYYYDAAADSPVAGGPQPKQVVLSTWLWFEVLLTVPAALLLIWLAEPVCQAFFNNAALGPVFRLGIFSVPLAIVARVFTLSLRLTFKALYFSIVIVSGALVQAIAAIGLVVVFHLGIEGVFWAMIASNLVQALLGAFLSRRNFRLVFSLPQLRQMLWFGVPLLPASLSLWVLNSSNRYFMNHYGTLVDVAVLGVGMRVANLVAFFISAFQNAWPPFAYSLLKDEALAKRVYARVLTYFLLVTMLLAVGLSIFAHEAILILATQKYAASTVLIPWLVFSAIAWGVVGIVGIGFEIAKKSYHFSIATILGSVITILLNLLLIPRLGVTGAAVATFSGNLAALAYGFYAGQKYFRVPYETLKITRLLLLAAVISWSGVQVPIWLAGAAQVFSSAWPFVLTAIKALFFGLFVFSIVAFKIIAWEDIQKVLASPRSLFSREGVAHKDGTSENKNENS